MGDYFSCRREVGDNSYNLFSCSSTPQRIRRGEVFTIIKMVGFRIILLFALLTLALSMPQEDMNMKIYRQCKKIYGIKPTKSCKTNRDCKVHINGNVKMCPEHDCLKDSNGKMKCSWQIFRK